MDADRLSLIKEMATDDVIPIFFAGPNHQWVHLTADIHHGRAARMEAAAGGDVHRAGDFAGGEDAFWLERFFLFGQDGDGRKEHLRVRVLGLFKEALRFGDFGDAPEVHDGDACGQVAHHAQIMRDE